MKPRVSDTGTDVFTACIRYHTWRAEQLAEKIRAAAPDAPYTASDRSALFSARMQVLTAHYSRGDALSALAPMYTSLAYCFLRNWQPEDNRSVYSYKDALRFASLTVLFGADEAMQEAVRRRLQEDSLTAHLLCADAPPPEETGLLHTEFALLVQAAQQQSTALLAEYLQEWYHGFRYDPWYSGHGLYENCGKWSFAAAAVAKRFRIPDEALKDDPFYPYALAHYVP